MEQLQGSLLLSIQGDPKILKDLKDQKLCSKCTHWTSQCGTFHQYAAGPHLGAGKSCNGNTSRQNINQVVDEYDLGALEKSFYSNRKTCNSAVRERPFKINRSIAWKREWSNRGPTKQVGAGLDKDIVNINENYINYIQSNPELVQTVDDLEVAETGKTGHYFTLYLPWKNKQLAVNPLSIHMPNE